MLLVVVLTAPVDIVCPASTTIAAASWALVFILLLGPAPVYRVPQFSAVRALVRLTLRAERLDRVFILDHRSICTLTLICSFVSTFTTSRDRNSALLISKFRTTFSKLLGKLRSKQIVTSLLRVLIEAVK